MHVDFLVQTHIVDARDGAEVVRCEGKLTQSERDDRRVEVRESIEWHMRKKQ